MPAPMLLSLALAALTASAPPGRAAAAREEVPIAIDWHVGSFADAGRAARASERSLCVYFWADSSDRCRELYQGALSRPEVAAALAGSVCFSADVAGEGRRLLDDYRISVLPTVLFAEPDGGPIDAIVGAVSPSEFLSQLQRIQRGVDTLPTLRRMAADAPDDLDLRLRLALKLDHVGLVDEGRAVVDAIRAEDPDGRSLVGARLAFWDVRDRLQAELDAAPDPTRVDLAPMRRHLRGLEHDAVRFEAYQWLHEAEAARGARAPAREALVAGWDVVPAGAPEAEWGGLLITTFFDQRDELDGGERRTMLAVARTLEERADAYEAAREAATTSGEVYPEPELPPRAMAHVALACAAFVNGRKDAARIDAEAAIALMPDDGELRRRLEPILAR